MIAEDGRVEVYNLQSGLFRGGCHSVAVAGQSARVGGRGRQGGKEGEGEWRGDKMDEERERED